MSEPKNKDLFEDVEYNATAPAVDSSLFEDVDHPEATLAAAPESDTPIKDMAEQSMDGAVGTARTGVGFIGGYAVGKGTNALLDKAITSKLGGSLSKEQQSYITANAPVYKQAKPLDEMMDQLESLTGKNRQNAFDYKDEALKVLEGSEKIPVQEYHSGLGKIAEKSKYSDELPEGTDKRYQEQRMSEIRPEIDLNAKASNELEAKISQLSGQQYVSPQESKIAKLQEMLKAPKADVPFMAKQKAGEALFGRKVQRNAEDLALNPENRKLNNKAEDLVFTRDVKQEETGTVRSHNNQAKLEKMQEQLAELKLKKETGTAKAIEKKKNDIANMTKNKASMDGKVNSLTKGAQVSAEADLAKARRTPEKIRATNPEFFNSKIMDDELADSLDSALKIPGEAEYITPSRLGERIIPRLRDGGYYDSTGASSLDKLNTDVAEGTRDWLGQKFPEYDQNMQKSSKSIKLEDKLGVYGIKQNDELNEMMFPEPDRKLLAAQVISDNDKWKSEKRAFNAIPKDMEELGLIPKENALLADLKNSALKQAVKDTDMLRMTGYDAMKAMQGSVSSAAKPIWDSKRTAFQEGVAQSKGLPDGLLNPATKMGKAVGNTLPFLFGAGGAAIAAMSAANAGELSPEAAGVAGVADAFNPTPTDIVAASVEGKKEYNNSVDEQKMTEEYFNGGDVSQSQAIASGAVGAAKGLVSPIPNLAMAAKDGAEAFGTSQSNDARSRMEQQMKSLDSFKPKEDPKKGNDFLNFVAKKPEALKELADQLTGAGQSFSGPLMKAAEGSEPQRAAILFGLYQQPAFRSLIGEGSLLNQNIPGVKKKDEDELTAVKVPRPM